MNKLKEIQINFQGPYNLLSQSKSFYVTIFKIYSKDLDTIPIKKRPFCKYFLSIATLSKS